MGFDLGRLEKTTDKRLRPPDAYDQLQVWRGIGPRSNEFYVEATAYSGKPGYLEVLEPYRFAPAAAERTLSPEAMMGWMYLAAIAGGVVLAWRNLRRRRSDRRGAMRVAFYFFCIGFLISAIHAHHTAGLAEGGVFEMALAQAAARAIVFWLWYTALEPYVRRLWPQTLISWSRLMEGRWRDPLVGSDLLAGCLFGVALNIVHQLHLLAPKWLGQGMHRFQSSPAWTLEGAASLLADVLFKQIDAVFFAMFFLVSLLLLRFVFRRMLLASAVFLVLVYGG